MKKENAIPVLIRRTFSYFDSPLFKKLFTTPHLEYGQVTWTPHLEKYITILENVQRRATKLVDGFNQMRYSEKLKKLNPPSQEILRHFDRDFQTFPSYDNSTLPENFRPRNRPSGKHDYQLVQKLPKMALENSRQFFSTFKRSKPGMSSEKKSYLPSLSTHLKTNWMKRGRIYQ